MVEVLGGILSGEGAMGDRTGPVHNGTFLLLIDVARFLPLIDFTGQVTDLVRYVKSATPAPGTAAVQVPGEPEARSEAERRAHGIPVEAETWRQIRRSPPSSASAERPGRRRRRTRPPRRRAAGTRLPRPRGFPDRADRVGPSRAASRKRRALAWS